jgi:hypothetical protein
MSVALEKIKCVLLSVPLVDNTGKEYLLSYKRPRSRYAIGTSAVSRIAVHLFLRILNMIKAGGWVIHQKDAEAWVDKHPKDALDANVETPFNRLALTNKLQHFVLARNKSKTLPVYLTSLHITDFLWPKVRLVALPASRAVS